MKDFKVNIPRGYEIDVENSSLNDGVIKFKEKQKCKRNIITKVDCDDTDYFPYYDTYKYCEINNEHAFRLIMNGVNPFRGLKEFSDSFHDKFGASIYLSNGSGTWCDIDGNEIMGYLFFKPNKE